MNTAERNIQYWKDYWASLFSGIEEQRHNLNMLNPRIVLRELAYEIEVMHLSNKNNMAYFQRLINYYFKYDPPSISCLNDILTQIRREFSNPRLAVLSHLCHEALNIIANLNYYDSIVDHLYKALTADKNISIKDIKLLCQDIIVELAELGYSNKYIENIPNCLFGEIVMPNGHIHSEFPHSIPYPGRNATESQKKDYDTKLREYLSRLSLSDRINAFKSIARASCRDFIIIFQIKGICGTDSFNICDVTFYSPHKEILMKDSNGIGFPKPPEYFNCDEISKDTSYYNAAIPIKAKELLGGVELSKQKLIKALNMLRYKYDSKAIYEISRDYIALDKDYKIVGSSSSLDHASGVWQLHYSLKINDGRLKSIKNDFVLNNIAPNIFTNKLGDINRKIGESLHWYRKAKETESLEDQILFFWICIENLLNPGIAYLKNGIISLNHKDSPVSIAFDILPRLRVIANIYSRVWATYDQLNNLFLTNKFTGVLDDHRIELPDDIKRQANLPAAVGKLIHIKDFVKALPSILDHIPDGLLRDHITEIHDICSNAKFAKEVICDEIKACTDELVLIYRIRNKIVHNADYDNSMLPNYVRSIESYAKALLNKVTARNYYGKSHVDVLVALYSEYDLLMNKLDKATSCEFLFDKE